MKEKSIPKKPIPAPIPQLWKGKLTGWCTSYHKAGDMQPGHGFFELARDLGRDPSDILACWITELKKVHAYWSQT